jgi:hypothetical protein
MAEGRKIESNPYNSERVIISITKHTSKVKERTGRKQKKKERKTKGRKKELVDTYNTRRSQG